MKKQKIIFTAIGSIFLILALFVSCDWEDRGGCPKGGTKVYSYPSGTKVIGQYTCQGACSQRGYKSYCWGSNDVCYGYN